MACSGVRAPGGSGASTASSRQRSDGLNSGCVSSRSMRSAVTASSMPSVWCPALRSVLPVATLKGPPPWWEEGGGGMRKFPSPNLSPSPSPNLTRSVGQEVEQGTLAVALAAEHADHQRTGRLVAENALWLWIAGC